MSAGHPKPVGSKDGRGRLVHGDTPALVSLGVLHLATAAARPELNVGVKVRKNAYCLSPA